MKTKMKLFMYKLDNFLGEYKNVIDTIVNIVLAIISRYF